MGGLKALFPPEAVQEALQGALENFTFAPEDENTREYDQTKFMPAVVPSSHGNKSHEESSPMHIDRDFHTAEFGTDRPRANTNLTNEELIGAYEFMKQRPEYGLAMKWVTGTITDLGKAIERELDINPTYAHLKESGLKETLGLITNDGARALMDGRLPVAVAAELAQNENEPAPDNINAAINQITTKNVLKRPRLNPAGESFTGMCPATRFNIMCLKTEIDGVPALTQFVHKIKLVAEGMDPALTDQDTINVHTHQHEFSDMMRQMLSTPEAIDAKADIELRKAALCPKVACTQNPHT